MFKPFRFLSSVSAIFFRSANENDGNSPVVPNTTTPSAPCDFKYASKSLYNSGSNFRSLSQGVDTATQNNIFSPEASAAEADASAAISALLRSTSSLFFVTLSATPPPNAGFPATPQA